MRLTYHALIDEKYRESVRQVAFTMHPATTDDGREYVELRIYVKDDDDVPYYEAFGLWPHEAEEAGAYLLGWHKTVVTPEKSREQ